MPENDTPTIIGCSDFAPEPDGEKSAQPRHVSVREPVRDSASAFDFTLAAPSFVIPAGAAENARFLADHFDEIGLLFFETEACLKYTDDDLPPDLAQLPVSWHVHLPLDLPWQAGIEAVWDALARLTAKAAHLSPRAWVLHPPTEPGLLTELASRFRQIGIHPAKVLLENVEESDLTAVWDEARSCGYSTCLDLGHIIAYGQHSVLDLPGLWQSVEMLHIYAPGKGGRHTSLANLDKNGQELLRACVRAFNGRAVTMEVFEEKGIFESVELFAHWLADWRNEK